MIVNSDRSFASMVGTISAEYKEHKHLTISVKAGVDRTVQQNRLWASMYKRLDQFNAFESAIEAKKYCKLMIGVPILNEESEDFRQSWTKHFGHLRYEDQLELMGPCSLFGPEGFPVTRLFTREQGRRYTENLNSHPEFIHQAVTFNDLLGDD
jgi:hypothetical protein